MPDDTRPYVDADARGSVGEYLKAVLERATPDRFVSGGASDDGIRDFSPRPRNYETLSERQEIYRQGGPITHFIDTRALMTYGTGVEFVTDDDTITDDQGRTVDEWLGDQFDRLDEHFIERGTQTYWAGDAWGEIVETRGGEFSHVELIDPTTIAPEWDRHGDITAITQVVETGRGQLETQPLDPDRIAHFWYKRSTGTPLGESLIGQNRDLIERYAENQAQRKNAIRLHGSPHYHVAVGSEGQSISDKLIRRVRDQFRSTDTDEKTNWVTGGEIEISELDAPGFEGMQSITETDIAMLASGFGIPLEWTNFGSDGLGSGAPAESRQTKFERQARAEQRRAAQQFIEGVVRYVLQEYSPFPRDIDVGLEFGDVVSDQQAAAEWMRDFKSYMTPEEIRTHLGLGPAPDDADLGPPEGTPDAEAPAEAGGGGLFSDVKQAVSDAAALSDYRTLQESFGVDVFKIVDDGDVEMDMQDALMGIGVDFPNAGVYIDWNIAAWPDDQQLSDAHVSDYSTMDDVRQVTQGEIVPLETVDPGGGRSARTATETSSTPAIGDGGGPKNASRALFHGEGSADDLTQEELVWADVYEHVLWADDTDRHLFEFDPEEVPQFVIERLESAVQQDALFESFETIPDWAAADIEDVMLDSLESRHGWSMDSIAQNLQDMALGLDKTDAERIARTETAALVNTAREEGYREQFGDDALFKWVGPQQPDRTTDACEWLKEQTNPDFGGEPVTLDRLQELVAEAPTHDPDMDDNLARPGDWVVHPQERHTHVRVVE